MSGGDSVLPSNRRVESVSCCCCYVYAHRLPSHVYAPVCMSLVRHQKFCMHACSVSSVRNWGCGAFVHLSLRS